MNTIQAIHVLRERIKIINPVYALIFFPITLMLIIIGYMYNAHIKRNYDTYDSHEQYLSLVTCVEYGFVKEEI